MNYLNNNNLYYFNTIGLREICRYNREIFMNYNKLSKSELIKYIKSKLINDINITVPPFIYNNTIYIAKYKIAKVI